LEEENGKNEEKKISTAVLPWMHFGFVMVTEN
jgi:hypothetical protein